MTKEETMLGRHLVDLSRQAYERGIPLYSNFLNLNEQNIFHGCASELYGAYELFGGYEGAERQMIAFLPDAFVFQGDYPLVCCMITPQNRRFSQELTHRDVLGSLMSLGIERETLGDILIQEQDIYVFCHSSIFAFIQQELTRIRNTPVSVTAAQPGEPACSPHLEACQGIVPSNRLDAVLAAMCRISRSQACDLIHRGLVFINGKQMSSPKGSCHPGEIISIRGTGRFQFLAEEGETRKGRIKISSNRYR